MSSIIIRIAAFIACLLLAVPHAAAQEREAQPLVPFIIPRLERPDPHKMLRDGDTALLHGKTDEAFALYTDAINTADLDQRSLAAAYVKRGRLSLRGGHDHQALADFRRAVELAPTEHHALSWRARAWLALQRPASAQDDAERGAALTPKSAFAQETLGLAFLAAGTPDSALKALDEAASLAPDNAAIHAARAQALTMLGRDDEAAEAARIALDLRAKGNDK